MQENPKTNKQTTMKQRHSHGAKLNKAQNKPSWENSLNPKQQKFGFFFSCSQLIGELCTKSALLCDSFFTSEYSYWFKYQINFNEIC